MSDAGTEAWAAGVPEGRGPGGIEGGGGGGGRVQSTEVWKACEVRAEHADPRSWWLCALGVLSEQASGREDEGEQAGEAGRGLGCPPCPPPAHPPTVPSAVSSLTDDLLKYYQQVTRAVLGDDPQLMKVSEWAGIGVQSPASKFPEILSDACFLSPPHQLADVAGSCCRWGCRALRLALLRG